MFGGYEVGDGFFVGIGINVDVSVDNTMGVPSDCAQALI